MGKKATKRATIDDAAETVELPLPKSWKTEGTVRYWADAQGWHYGYSIKGPTFGDLWDSESSSNRTPAPDPAAAFAFAMQGAMGYLRRNLEGTTAAERKKYDVAAKRVEVWADGHFHTLAARDGKPPANTIEYPVGGDADDGSAVAESIVAGLFSPTGEPAFDPDGDFEAIEAPIREEAGCRLRLRVYTDGRAWWVAAAFRGAWSCEEVKDTWEWAFDDYLSNEHESRQEALVEAVKLAVGDLRSYLQPPFHKCNGRDVEQLRLAVEDLEKWLRELNGEETEGETANPAVAAFPKPNEHGVFEDKARTVEIPIPKSYKTKLRIHPVLCEDGWRYSYDFSSDLGGYGGSGGPAMDRDPGLATEFEAIQNGAEQAIRWMEHHARLCSAHAAKAKVAKVVDLARAWLVEQQKARDEEVETESNPSNEQPPLSIQGLPRDCKVVVDPHRCDEGKYVAIVRVSLGEDYFCGETPACSTRRRAELYGLSMACDLVADHLAKVRATKGKGKAEKIKTAELVWGRISAVKISHGLLNPESREEAEDSREAPESQVETTSVVDVVEPNASPSPPEPDFEAEYKRREEELELAVGRATRLLEEARSRWKAFKKTCGVVEAEEKLREAKNALTNLAVEKEKTYPLWDGKGVEA